MLNNFKKESNDMYFVFEQQIRDLIVLVGQGTLERGLALILSM
jgi:hypothetical protein